MYKQKVKTWYGLSDKCIKCGDELSIFLTIKNNNNNNNNNATINVPIVE